MRGIGVSGRIVISPERLDLGAVVIGDTSSSALMIRNEGNDLLFIHKITVNHPAFSVLDVPFILTPGTGRGLRVGFRASTSGTASAEVSIHSDDRRRRVVTVPVSAVGRPAPDVSLSDVSHAYGFVTPGVSVPWTLIVRNTGTERLTITGVRADLPFIFEEEFPKVVAVSDSLPLVISFSPPAEGEFKGRLAILTDDPDEPEVYVNLSGSAVKVALSLDLDPTPGNQNALSGQASLSAPFQVAVYVAGVSEISAYSFVVEFDTAAVRFISGSEKTDSEDNILKKSGGNALFLPPLRAGNAVSCVAAVLGPTPGALVSGDGLLGVLTFEGLEGVKTPFSARFILRQVGLKGLRGREQQIATRVVAEVKLNTPGDLNGDDRVDLADFFEFGKDFGLRRGMPGFHPGCDLNGDGIIDLTDFFILVENFGTAR